MIQFKPEWEIVKEPQSPRAMKRLTVQEKQYLLIQHQLAEALVAEDRSVICRSLVDLGLFNAALEFAVTSDDHSRVDGKLRAVEQKLCKCPKVQHPFKEWSGAQESFKQTSNFIASRKVPQGMLYKCIHCKKEFLCAGPPDELVQQLEASRANFPDLNDGSDKEVLPNA